jgi:hypothetical protein
MKGGTVTKILLVSVGPWTDRAPPVGALHPLFNSTCGKHLLRSASLTPTLTTPPLSPRSRRLPSPTPIPRQETIFTAALQQELPSLLAPVVAAASGGAPVPASRSSVRSTLRAYEATARSLHFSDPGLAALMELCAEAVKNAGCVRVWCVDVAAAGVAGLHGRCIVARGWAMRTRTHAGVGCVLGKPCAYETWARAFH